MSNKFFILLFSIIISYVSLAEAVRTSSYTSSYTGKHHSLKRGQALAFGLIPIPISRMASSKGNSGNVPPIDGGPSVDIVSEQSSLPTKHMGLSVSDADLVTQSGNVANLMGRFSNKSKTKSNKQVPAQLKPAVVYLNIAPSLVDNGQSVAQPAAIVSKSASVALHSKVAQTQIPHGQSVAQPASILPKPASVALHPEVVQPQIPHGQSVAQPAHAADGAVPPIAAIPLPIAVDDVVNVVEIAAGALVDGAPAVIQASKKNVPIIADVKEVPVPSKAIFSYVSTPSLQYPVVTHMPKPQSLSDTDNKSANELADGDLDPLKLGANRKTSVSIAGSGRGFPPITKAKIAEAAPVKKQNVLKICDELAAIATDTTNGRVSNIVGSMSDAWLGMNEKDNADQDGITGVAAGDNASSARWSSVWIRGLYGDIKQGNTEEERGFHGKTGGGTIGIDGNLTDETLLGVSYTRMYADFKYNADYKNTVDTVSNMFSVYGITKLSNNFILHGLFSTGQIGVKQKSQRLVGGSYVPVSSKFNVNVYTLESVLNYKILSKNRNYYIMPNIGVNFSKNHNSKYNEVIGGYKFPVDSKKQTSFATTLGMKVGKIIRIAKGFKITPRLHLEADNYAQDETGYNLGGDVLIKRKNTEILTTYNCHLRGKYISHQGSLKFKWMF